MFCKLQLTQTLLDVLQIGSENFNKIFKLGNMLFKDQCPVVHM
jgi:hypothetical protein